MVVATVKVVCKVVVVARVGMVDPEVDNHMEMNMTILDRKHMGEGQGLSMVMEMSSTQMLVMMVMDQCMVLVMVVAMEHLLRTLWVDMVIQIQDMDLLKVEDQGEVEVVNEVDGHINAVHHLTGNLIYFADTDHVYYES